jgi:hypothetical protein
VNCRRELSRERVDWAVVLHRRVPCPAAQPRHAARVDDQRGIDKAVGRPLVGEPDAMPRRDGVVISGEGQRGCCSHTL